jgi:potassium-dependent mechanosensitive channel
MIEKHHCMGSNKTNGKVYCIKQAWQGLLLIATLFFTPALQAQKTDSTASNADTAGNTFVKRAQQLANAEAARSIERFKKDKVTIRQELLLEQIRKATEKAGSFIKSGLDTIAVATELDKIDIWYNIAGDGIFTNTGTSQTHRNLVTTSKILNELLHRCLLYKTKIDAYEKELTYLQYRIDSLNSDSVLYDFPSDSVALTKYIKKVTTVLKSVMPSDSALKVALPQIYVLQARASLLADKLAASLVQVDEFDAALSSQIFKREFVNLGGPVGFNRPFADILNVSVKKGLMNLRFYLGNNLLKIVLLLLLVIVAVVFLRGIKKMLQQSSQYQQNYSQLVLRYPLLSAILIVFSIFQFILPDPPFVINCLLWVSSAICLTIIFKGYITRYWMVFWLSMFLLFLLACAGNLVLQASRTERWLMLLVSLAGIGVSVFVLKQNRRHELREKLILYFIVLLLLFLLLSACANIFGRYNFSKTLLTTGFFNIVVGILFLWTVRLINQALALASTVYAGQDKKLFYINFNKVGNRVPRLFYVFLVLGWLILMARNFYAFKLVSVPIRNMFFEERTIGSYTFTLSNLFVFFIILGLATLISKLVSFFAGDKHINTGGGEKERKPGLGSWLLLVRVGIISIGLFLALAASGFPLDKITIVIGALGVGIGFGMQTLVNNLVSGLIIAFEKPVNVGDIVEIGGQEGVMKSIGFRSSIISTWDGANVVIPNGDLLNLHLVNWTMSNSRRRICINFTLAHATNLQEVKTLILQLLEADERVLKTPPPAVLVKEYNNHGIPVEAFFWVANIKKALLVKSDVFSQLDEALKARGIQIPFTHQELHINTNDNDTKNTNPPL